MQYDKANLALHDFTGPEARGAIQNVLCLPDKTVASNGCILVMMDLPEQPAREDDELIPQPCDPFLLSKASAKQIISTAKTKQVSIVNDHGTTSVQVMSQYGTIDASMNMPTPDDVYPKYEQVIPDRPEGYIAHLDVDMLAKVCKVAKLADVATLTLDYPATPAQAVIEAVIEDMREAAPDYYAEGTVSGMAHRTTLAESIRAHIKGNYAAMEPVRITTGGISCSGRMTTIIMPKRG